MPTNTPSPSSIRHGGDRVADALLAHGVPSIFTLCGGHISPILSAAKARGIRIVDVRDEATAVFAADATARLTGLPGVAAVTAGPGISNTITALKNAQLAQSPVILIGGAAPTALQGRGALQDIDQRPLVAPHVKLFRKITRVRDLGPAVDEAFEVAQAGVPGPVFIECPVDLLYDEASIRQWYADAAGKGTSLGRPGAALVPEPPRPQDVRRQRRRRSRRRCARSPRRARRDASLKAALAALAKAERPLMVIGSQALVMSREAESPGRGRGETRHPRVPVRHGARPAGARPPAADAPPAPQGPARGRLRAAGRRALRLPARLRQTRAPQRHADRRQPQHARTRA